MARVNTEAARQAGRSQYSNGNGSQQSPPSSSSTSSTDLPLAMDSIETDDAVTFWADVPGLNKADLKVRSPAVLYSCKPRSFQKVRR